MEGNQRFQLPTICDPALTSSSSATTVNNRIVSSEGTVTHGFSVVPHASVVGAGDGEAEGDEDDEGTDADDDGDEDGVRDPEGLGVSAGAGELVGEVESVGSGVAGRESVIVGDGDDGMGSTGGVGSATQENEEPCRREDKCDDCGGTVATEDPEPSKHNATEAQKIEHPRISAPRTTSAQACETLSSWPVWPLSWIGWDGAQVSGMVAATRTPPPAIRQKPTTACHRQGSDRGS